jgi:hypothetical protein
MKKIHTTLIEFFGSHWFLDTLGVIIAIILAELLLPLIKPLIDRVVQWIGRLESYAHERRHRHTLTR